MKSKIKTRLENSVLLHCVIFGSLLFLILTSYYLVSKWVHHSVILCEDDFSWMYQVDTVVVDAEEIVLTGFAFQLEKDAEKKSFEIVIQDTKTKDNFYPEMQYFQRTDVKKYFSQEFNYLESGFCARIESKKLDLDNVSYQILLQPVGTRKAYQTNIFLHNGQLMYVNPAEYIPLKVDGTDLEEIFRKQFYAFSMRKEIL